MATVGSLTIGMKVDTKEFDKQISYIESELEEIEHQLKQADMGIEVGDTRKLEKRYEELSNRLVDLRKKKQDFNKQPLDDGGPSGFGGLIKKITKIGLGLIGLRTGLALLRSSVRTVADQNDAIALKLNTIKSVLANALTPVVEYVINLFAKLISYVGYLLKNLFGINIFAKNTASSTKNMKNNLGGANKEASKLKRTLAGFDEMNILSSTGVSTGGGGGGISASDIDMSMFDNIEMPGWIQWIIDNKDKLLETLKQLAIMVATAFAIGSLISFIKELSNLKFGLLDLKNGFASLSKVELAVFLTGIATAIAGLIGLITNLVSGTETAKSVLSSLGLVIAGLSVALLALNASNPLGWIGLAIGATMELVSWFMKEEEQVYDTATAQERLNKAQDEYNKQADALVSAYENMDQAEQHLTETAKKHNMTREQAKREAMKLFDEFQRGGRAYEEFGDEEKELIKLAIEYKGAQDKLGDELQNHVDLAKNIRAEEIKKQESIAYSTRQYEAYRDALADAWEHGEYDTMKFASAMEMALWAMDEEARQTFVEKIPDDVKHMLIQISSSIQNNKLPGLNIYATLDTSKAQAQLKKFKAQYPMLFPFAKGGIVQYAKGGILNLPRLAPGGLINKPGPGVAIGGEKGTEGVVPLTDSQQMARLGAAIGQYVNIRAEMPVYIGKRQITREIRNINADEDFAYNGG